MLENTKACAIGLYRTGLV